MPIVGIDIGTSSCSVAMMIDGQPQVLPVFDGHDEMPTYVAFTTEGERLIGWPAKRQSVMNPANTIFTIKRLIGRKFATPETQAELGLLPYQVSASGSGGLWVQAGGRSYTPTEITAMMLGEVRRATETYLGASVEQAVITVPAYFDENQVRATIAAAKIAGIEVLRHIAEPSAAALAYGIRSGSGTIAVYDLGGGTFDISILEIGDGVFEVKAVNGDNRLGGEDFDHKLVRHFVEQIAHERGVDLSHDPLALHRIKDAAEQIKIRLDSERKASILLQYLFVKHEQFVHAELSLTQDALARLVGELIDRTLAPCKKALKDAGLRGEQLDALILVGGMSRMPAVRKRVGEFFGRAPKLHHDPARIVALGAAIQAGVLAGDVKDILLLDVIPLSFGISASDGSFVSLVERNTTIPTKREFKFDISSSTTTIRRISERRTFDWKSITIKHDARLTRFQIYEGEDRMVNNNLLLVELNPDLTVAPSGMIEIEILFDIWTQSRLSIVLKNLYTNTVTRKDINVALNPFTIAEDAGSKSPAIATEERLVAIRAQAEGLLNTVDAALLAHRRSIRPDILSAIEEGRNSLQKAMESRDAEELSGALSAFAAVANMSPPPSVLKPIPMPVDLKAVTTGATIFVSYARADRAWMDRLRTHLTPLEREGKIEIWHDGKIETGAPWRFEIDSAINKAVAAVLLVTANFMASQFIYENELPPILKRHEVGGLRIYPIIIGHVFYQLDKDLTSLNTFNDPKQPLSALSYQDAEKELARLTGLIWELLEQRG